MKSITFRITGTAPLIVHNSDQLSDPTSTISREIHKHTSKRGSNKTLADHRRISNLEFIGGLYMNASGPILPGANLRKALIEGAKRTKEGKNVERGVSVFPDAVLEYDGPRTAKDLYEFNRKGDEDNWDSKFINRKSMKVGQSRVMRTRPQFPEWACTVTFNYDPTVVNADDLERFFNTAGQQVGVGDSRPGCGHNNGTFTAKVVQPSKEKVEQELAQPAAV